MRTTKWLWVAGCIAAAGCAALRPAPPRSPTPAELAALETRAQRDTGNSELQLQLAGAYLQQGRAGDALPIAERVRARGGSTGSRAVLLLGAAHEDLGHYADARDCYRLALRATRTPKLRAQLQQRLVLLQRREAQAYVRAAVARETELANAAPRPRTLAVFPLGVSAPDSLTGPLGYALTAMLITDLSQTDRLTVLDRSVIQALLDEIELGRSGLVDARTAARGGRLLQAERIVQGSLAFAQDQFTVDVAVARVNPARARAAAPGTSVTDRDRLDRLFDLEKRLALKLYAALGIELTPAERAEVTKVRTENLQALLAYGRGLQASDAGDLAGALRFFSEANRLDPGFAMAREQVAAVSAVAAATSVTTRQLAASATAAVATATAWAMSIPAAAFVRDAVAELLGTEGLSEISKYLTPRAP